MGKIFDFAENYFSAFSSLATIRWNDIIEILLIAVFVYQFMLWIRNTRAYSSFEGDFNCVRVYLFSIFVPDEHNFVVGLYCRRVCNNSGIGYFPARA